MTTRLASCFCGQLQLSCTGEPVRISVCHCLDCQKRSGSAFAVQARWPNASVTIVGDFREWSREGESGQRSTFRFCPACGGTISYVNEGMAGVTAVAVGSFADPDFPPPDYSVYEERKHVWVQIEGEGIEHFD
jgi:hypothetical protein